MLSHFSLGDIDTIFSGDTVAGDTGVEYTFGVLPYQVFDGLLERSEESTDFPSSPTTSNPLAHFDL